MLSQFTLPLVLNVYKTVPRRVLPPQGAAVEPGLSLHPSGLMAPLSQSLGATGSVSRELYLHVCVCVCVQ